MSNSQATPRRRINVSLPEKTIALIDRVTERGNRSHLIDQAVRRYLSATSRAKLRKLMKNRADRRAALNRQLAEDWLPLEEKVWGEPDRAKEPFCGVSNGLDDGI